MAVDIRKAYWSVYLEEPEAHLHRVLWNELDPEKTTKVYKMSRNSWGSKPAGSICSLAMLILAEMFAEKFPKVYEFISQQMYVDDGVMSYETVEEALELARDTAWVMSQGNFSVKHFIIGGRSVDVTSGQRTDLPQTVSIGEEEERILGVFWTPPDDTIGFSGRVNFSPKKRGSRVGSDICEDEFDEKFPEVLSQRMYLSHLAGLFDPLGLATPYSIILKHELGRIFMLELGWDAAIPHGGVCDKTTTHERCKEIIKMIYNLSRVRFPRCLRPISIPGDSRPILVIFGDASQTAYGACAYFNWDLGSGRESRLVLAKARPIPKRDTNLTIPRAELMGATLVVRLLTTIKRATTYELEEIVLCTDSTCVLGQINTLPLRLKTWPASRVDEIQQCSELDSWFHVASEQNVADDACRGLAPQYVGLGSRWQCGPEFLKRPRGQWPLHSPSDMGLKSFSDKNSELMELRSKNPSMDLDRVPNVSFHIIMCDSYEAIDQDQSTMNILQTLNIRDCEPGDSWGKRKRMVARIIRFIENGAMWFRKPIVHLPSFSNDSERSKWINANDTFVPIVRELEMAERYWIFRAQSVLDSKCGDGIWRCSLRTGTPILLPAGPVALVILLWNHRVHHPGAQATLAVTRQRFWIIRGPHLANKAIANCARCRKLRKKPVSAEMAPLRSDQCSRSAVFEKVAIDLCGPYRSSNNGRHTRQNPSRQQKVWILVIICRFSKAVHFELVEGYDTKNLLAALDNFIHIRATPRSIIADRGSQIVSASNTLEQLWTDQMQSTLRNHMVESTIWEFAPSGAHEFIGIAERLVATFNRTLEAVTHSDRPVFSKLQFSRILYSIANLINDRPLGLGRIDPNKSSEDLLVRPNDLLLGRSSGDSIPLVEEPTTNLIASKRDEYLQLVRQKEAFLNAFWVKWYNIYFHTLAPRTKWTKSDRQTSVGDVVLIRDTNPVRGEWHWGEIIQTYKSSDGLIRKATVRYKNPPLKELSQHPSKGSSSRYLLKSVRDLVLLLPAKETKL